VRFRRASRSKIKVLYVAGWGRSGSTILDSTLGQLDGFFSVGEVSYLWERNLIQNRPCGCGRSFRECPVWGRVMNGAYGGMDEIDPEEMIRLRDSGARSRHMPLMLAPWGRSLLRSRLGKYPDSLERLYRAIRDDTGCSVIIDSSKLPSYGYVLGMISSIDLYIVHLVRDPRAVAYSWLRKKLDSDTGEYMPRYTAVQSALVWSAWNLAVEAFWKRQPERYMMLRYEDFVGRPQESVERIRELVREEGLSLPFVAEREVRLGVNHTVGGNPNRFNTGTVELRPDEEWKAKMGRMDRRTVAMLTRPLRARYGYL
jgi:hypothetical protein